MSVLRERLEKLKGHFGSAEEMLEAYVAEECPAYTLETDGDQGYWLVLYDSKFPSGRCHANVDIDLYDVQAWAMRKLIEAMIDG